MSAHAYGGARNAGRLMILVLRFLARNAAVFGIGAGIGILVGLGVSVTYRDPPLCPRSLAGFHGLCLYGAPPPPKPL
jgi:hypothetical protein